MMWKKMYHTFGWEFNPPHLPARGVAHGDLNTVVMMWQGEGGPPYLAKLV